VILNSAANYINANSFSRRTPHMSAFALRRLANTTRSRPWQLRRLQMVWQPTFLRFNSTTPSSKSNDGAEAKSATEIPSASMEVSGNGVTDWSKSYHGLSVEPFSDHIRQILQTPVDPLDVECKPGMSLFLGSCLGTQFGRWSHLSS